MDKIKQARIVGIPRQGVLKPAHAATRLRDQHFQLGDRVITVAETGSVPLSAKGVVVGIQSQFVDVVFDVQFMGGTTLGGRSVVFPPLRTTSDRLLMSLSRTDAPTTAALLSRTGRSSTCRISSTQRVPARRRSRFLRATRPHRPGRTRTPSSAMVLSVVPRFFRRAACPLAASTRRRREASVAACECLLSAHGSLSFLTFFDPARAGTGMSK